MQASIALFLQICLALNSNKLLKNIMQYVTIISRVNMCNFSVIKR